VAQSRGRRVPSWPGSPRGVATSCSARRANSYAQRFEEQLDVVASEFVVGETAAAKRLHLVFADPGERLDPQRPRAAAASRYALKFRVLVSDSADQVVATIDTCACSRRTRRCATPHI